MKVLMIPHLDQLGEHESGIKTVVRHYFRHLPSFGVDLVPPKSDSFDILAVHAGTTDRLSLSAAVVAHVHGLYWTADYPAHPWEWGANAAVIHSVRYAREITVPSEWVAETFQRDMRFTPHVIHHGIDWDAWQHSNNHDGYVLWNKNRIGLDVCDSTPVIALASAFTDVQFVTTFVPKEAITPSNVTVIGILPHDRMRKTVQHAAVYMSTVKETFGIGILEAMAAGVPVLGFDQGGIKLMVKHGVNGYLASPGDYQDLADGLAYCLEYRDMLGDNGRHMARQWTWPSQVKKVAGIYQLAVAPRASTVGVVIPTHNKPEHEVERAIKSALEQENYIPSQIVVVDDASDNGEQINNLVSSLQEQAQGTELLYRRVNYRNVADTRNYGISLLDTAYVVALDADDWLDPLFLTACVPELDQNQSLGIAYTGLTYHKPDGETGLSPWPGDWDFNAQLQRKNQIPTCCVFRKEMWERLGGYRSRYAKPAGSEDAEFWLRAGAYGWKAKKVTDAGLFHYSWMSGIVSSNKEYREEDWTVMHPWTKDGQHPFASYALSVKYSHPVRQYDEPLVSVVVPVGPGHEELLYNALDSLEAQTFRGWEVIVVWDSPLINTLYRAYPYVRWIYPKRKKPLGAGAARNIGVRYARAPLLLFLDADDSLYPKAIESMLSYWDTHQAAIYSDYVTKSDVKDVSQLDPKLRRAIVSRDEATGETITRHGALDYDKKRAQSRPSNPPYLWCNVTTLIPTSWHYEIGGFDESMTSWEDVLYFYQLAWLGKPFYRLPEPLLVYRMATGSRRVDGGRQWDKLIAYLQQKHDEFWK